MTDDASRSPDGWRGLHRWPAEQDPGGSWFSEQNTSDPAEPGPDRSAPGRSGPAEPGPSSPSPEQNGDTGQSIERRYADAIAAMNRIVATLDFSTLPWVTEVFRATAGLLHEQDPARAGVLNNLGSASQLTYLRSGDLEDLEDAVSYYRAAVSTARTDDTDLVLYQCNLALALTDQATRTSSPETAAEATEAGRLATDQASRRDPRRVMALVRRGNALKLHARLAHHADSNDESINVFRDAARSTAGTGSAETPELLTNLGSALLRRYERTRVAEDLDDAITQLRTGVDGLGDGEPRRAALCELAHALRLRFQHSGNLGDLTAAINELIGLLGILDARHPLLGRTLWNLAATAVEHVDSTGEPDQMRNALPAMGPAVRGLATDDPDRAIALAAYGALLRRHFLHGAEPVALDTAIAAGETAAEVVSPEHHGAVRNSLTTTLVTRYEHSGHTTDLDRAAHLAEQAAADTPRESAPKYTAWTQQGIIAAHRFRRSSKTRDLDLAIDWLDQALTAMPETAPGRAAVATHLGRALRTLHRRTGRRRLYRWARRVLTEAATLPSAPSDQRLRAASLCGRLAAQSQRWSEALESFGTAVELLPLVTRGKRVVASPSAQQHWMTITADAAACALENGEPERAVELLEHGRTAILADFLPAGGELGRLHQDMPDLADEAVRLRRLLDRPPEEPALGDVHLAADGERGRLVRAWDALLDEVRTAPGHEDHLTPPSFTGLARAAENGAVVLVNVSRFRSDALIVFAGRVLIVPLPKIDPESAAAQATEVLSAAQRGDPQALTEALDWSWRRITRPVLDRMGYVRTPVAGERWPRIWWSCLGALAFVPLHAATARSGECVLDRAVSSYTPSLRTLERAQRREPRQGGRALVAAGSSERIARELPMENRILARYWPNAEITSVEATSATGMLGLLQRHPWVHICEPGVQYPAQPASSILLDREAPERPLGLIELGQIPLDDAEFGYLGGRCVTAADTPTGAAVTLAGALGFSGFAHAVGTLWDVDRDSAVRVQSDVYYEVFGRDQTSSGRSAHALHTAALRLRTNYPDQPDRWAAYVHVGP